MIVIFFIGNGYWQWILPKSTHGSHSTYGLLRQHNTFHDKVFLCVRVRQSSFCAATYYHINHIMVFLNLLLLFCETLNRFQHNGEDTFACKRIAQWHCTNLNRQFCIENHATKTCQQTKIENPGCFPNVTNGYKGKYELYLYTKES